MKTLSKQLATIHAALSDKTWSCTRKLHTVGHMSMTTCTFIFLYSNLPYNYCIRTLWIFYIVPVKSLDIHAYLFILL